MDHERQPTAEEKILQRANAALGTPGSIFGGGDATAETIAADMPSGITSLDEGRWNPEVRELDGTRELAAHILGL